MLKEIADVESKKAEGEITGEEKRAPPKEEFGKPKKSGREKAQRPLLNSLFNQGKIKTEGLLPSLFLLSFP